jgi:single-stranded-DNA-specific exonuclease
MVKDRGNPVCSRQYAVSEIEEQKIIKSLEDSLGVPNLIAKILLSRGIVSPDDGRTFLYPKLEDLSDPFLLPDIERGVERTVEAVMRKEKICLYGDYDADGIASTALMMNFFKHLGITPETYIPSRKEGYGLNLEAIKMLKEKGIRLLICLDCGSTNVEEIKMAKDLNIDIVVIDHHELSVPLPDANALINPKRVDAS